MRIDFQFCSYHTNKDKSYLVHKFRKTVLDKYQYIIYTLWLHDKSW